MTEAPKMGREEGWEEKEEESTYQKYNFSIKKL